MIETCLHQGRLGNRILELLGAGVLAQKLNLYLSPGEIYLGNPTKVGQGIDVENFISTFYINPKLHEGVKITDPLIEFTDDMCKENMDIETYKLGHYKLINASFQIPSFIAKYYEELRNVLLPINPIKHNPGVFVHSRVGDVMPPRTATYEYYMNCLEKINPSGGVFSSEDANRHPMIKEICKKFNLELIHKPSAENILYGSSFEHLILDAGTYSFIIGLLSNAKTKYVYFPPPGQEWCTNYAQSLPGWNVLTI